MIIKKWKKRFKLITISFIYIPMVLIATKMNDDSNLKKKIPMINSWYKPKGSMTINGGYGKIFQAENGDLYVMGYRTGLEVLKNGASSFIPAPGSQINNGAVGTIFQTKNGDLYVMGYKSGLEVLKNGASSFIPVSGSKITNGKGGAIFQAKNGDLYVMGYKSGLEVLKSGASNFIPASGSKTTNGDSGIIFQAKNGDVYAMGSGTGLEVLKNGASSFTSASGSQITSGSNGIIFQAKNGDVYAMGSGTGLEVLKNGTSSFTSASGSITNNGKNGTIFQTENGDLYVMGYGTGLEVLKNGASSFASASGSKINNGDNGVIFQTKNGDVYAMGSGTGLEVLKNGTSSFASASGSITNNGKNGTIFQAKNGDLYVMGSGTGPEVLKNGTNNFAVISNSIITNGDVGTIFQVKNGDIYMMAYGTGLEVLKNNLLKFTKTDETVKGKNNGTITIANFKNKYSKVQYKKTTGLKWTDLPENGKITSLAPGTYQFQWVGKKGEQYEGTMETFKTILKTIDIIVANKINVPSIILTFTKTDETAKGKNNGTITITNFKNKYSKMQYKKTTGLKWTDLPENGKLINLEPGTYQFQWIGKNGEQYEGTEDIFKAIKEKIIIKDAIKITVPKTPVFIKNNETVKGRNDGFVIVAGGTNTYSKLKYKLQINPTWINLPIDNIIENLAPGTYQFQWVSKNGEQYEGTKDIFKAITEKVIIKDAIKIAIPTNPTFSKTNETGKNKNDGTITITNFKNKYSKVQYKKTTGLKWTDLPENGKLINLEPGTYQFQWIGKNGELYEEKNSKTIDINGKQTIDAKKVSDDKKIILATTIPMLFITTVITIILLIRHKSSY